MRSFFQLALDLFDGVPDPAAPVSATTPASQRHAPVLPAQPLASVLTPAQFLHPRANRQTRLCNAQVAYEFKRVRRRTIGMVVGADGLVVRAPNWVPLYEVEAALQEKATWIVRKLGEMRERQQRLETARIEWREGSRFPFMGQEVVVVLDPSRAYRAPGAALKAGQVEVVLQMARSGVPESGQPGLSAVWPCKDVQEGSPPLTLHIGLSQHAQAPQIRDAVQAWLMRQAQQVFTERLQHFAPLLGVQWRKLSLSSAGTRWGSASSDGSIRLNWRLIHFRQNVIDYVVAHELSHLRVMDHSPRFWDTVGSVVPDYQRLRGELRDESVPRWD